ncbi:MAG TPA: nucleotide kinase domain-containing protein [candidate division Zixibacteria bacterium]|nr:nucleotide kinase domain-containing protein [candidate division Zixibacteria bacterium]
MNTRSKLPNLLSPAKPTSLYDEFWHFAAKRQEIFFNKFKQQKDLVIEDPVINEYKFTNAYRASDRVSQYLIRFVQYNKEQSVPDVFFRTLLFKFFNSIETWQLLQSEVGEISYRNINFDTYDKVLTKALRVGKRVFSGAYIMPSGTTTFGSHLKHRNLLQLLRRLMEDKVPGKIKKARSMQKAFCILREYPMLGDFLAYQYVIDLNYSSILSFSEMDFVMPGPGARSGLNKCFSSLGNISEPELIRFVTEIQEEEFQRRGIKFTTLWGRTLQLIDIQNLFCEIDKYSRIAYPSFAGGNGRKRVKQRYLPKKEAIEYWYPPKWGIDTTKEPVVI